MVLDSKQAELGSGSENLLDRVLAMDRRPRCISAFGARAVDLLDLWSGAVSPRNRHKPV